MLRNPAFRFEREVPDLKVATNHISDRKNNAKESARWTGGERPCLITLSVPESKAYGF
jgi:hypothetical protein